ncbi:MAG: nucleic acid binding OB-fold tRNA/helicase-type, partial [Hyphomicrobiales bacterium]|nr:nucleic acid binding OB-fold tRNA/helicase-type [Hyphomicrobiales bacterium]
SHSGEFVLVEGRILRLGQTSARFYLDFEPARGVDLSVTISKQASKAFSAAGVRIESLPGQRVRIRGQLEDRPGPSIDLVSPLALETIGR